MRILETGNEFRQCPPQFADVFGGLGQIVRKLDFRVAQLAQLVDGQLEAVLILVDQAFDLYEIFLLKSVERIIHVVPHLCFQMAAAVPQRERQVRLA